MFEDELDFAYPVIDGVGEETTLQSLKFDSHPSP